MASVHTTAENPPVIEYTMVATPVTRMINSYENPSSWFTRIASRRRMMPERALCITRKHALA